MDKLQILERFDEEEVRSLSPALSLGKGVHTREGFMDRTPHIGIQVHGIHKVHPWVFHGQITHGGEHTDKAVSEILTAVTCDQDKLLSILQSSDVISCLKKDRILLFSQCGIIVKFANHHVEGIYHGITRDKYITMCLLLKKILLRKRCRREVIGSDTPCYLTVHLLGPRTIDIVCTETSLHVTYGYLLIECGKGGSR